MPTQQEIEQIKTTEEEFKQFATIALQTFKDYKAGGAKAAAADLPNLIKEGKEAFAAGKATYDSMKSGHTTSEFIIIAVYMLGDLTAQLTGHPLPLSTEVTLGGLIAIYTIARTFIKGKDIVTPVDPPAPVVTTTTTTKT